MKADAHMNEIIKNFRTYESNDDNSSLIVQPKELSSDNNSEIFGTCEG